MNTAAGLRCQTAGCSRIAPFLGILLGLLSLAFACGAIAEPTPPPWQRELDAVRLAETTAGMLAAGQPSPAEAVATDRRLGELYRNLAARYPDQAAVRKAAGDYFWRAADPDAAVDEWQVARTLDPNDAETASALGSAQLRLGHTAEARQFFQAAVDCRPEVARHHFDLANVLFIFRHEFVGTPGLIDEAAVFRSALAHFRQASELAPHNVEFARGYAETFYGLPDPDWTAALAAWEHVRTLEPDAQDFANAQLARASLRLGKPHDAEAYLELIGNPAFEPVKATLRRQATRMEQDAPTATPAP